MSFDRFEFHPKIAAGIKACNFIDPTPIQQQAIPAVLQGEDLMGLAQTGTGKTAAFVLPLLQHLIKGRRGKIRALIVAPTRELAEQIHSDIGRMGAQTGIRSVSIYGGVSKHSQLKKLRDGVEIVVACPGRLLDHLSEGNLSLSNVEHLVLDEADHMFDMGFLPAIRRIIKNLPKKRQNLLFSATMANEIRHLAEDILVRPVTVQIDHTRPTDTVSHVLFAVEQPRKAGLLKHLIDSTEISSALIFTRTKHKAKSLGRKLENAGYMATSIQGNLSQNKRQQALDGFRSGKYKILVATDIAARGIDVSGISHVINFDMPDTVEAYTHRIGRTGRAACTGEAYTFAGREDKRMVDLIERTLGKKMTRQQPDIEIQAEAEEPRPPRPHNRPQQKRGARPARKKSPSQQPRRNPRAAAVGFNSSSRS